MDILIACEWSGITREAFKLKGHNVWSCDLEPTAIEGQHYLGDVLDIIGDSWDMMIAFPPCTHLACSGARWFKYKLAQQANAIKFVEALWSAAIPMIAIENPVGVLSTKSLLGTPTQIIQPCDFGHLEPKRTCYWLKGLSPLTPTDIVEPEYVIYPNGVRMPLWYSKTGSACSKERGIAFQGVANAMANQWG